MGAQRGLRLVHALSEEAGHVCRQWLKTLLHLLKILEITAIIPIVPSILLVALLVTLEVSLMRCRIPLRIAGFVILGVLNNPINIIDLKILILAVAAPLTLKRTSQHSVVLLVVTGAKVIHDAVEAIGRFEEVNLRLLEIVLLHALILQNILIKLGNGSKIPQIVNLK